MSGTPCNQEGCEEAATVVIGQGDTQVRMCDEHWNRAMRILGIRKGRIRADADRRDTGRDG